MIDWQTLSIISLFLNVALSVAVFFKSALNDIMKEWWLNRRKSKEIEVQRLINFKTKFNIQQTRSLLAMIMLAQKQVGIIMGQKVSQFVEDSYKESLDTTSEARNTILEIIDYLPLTLREKYRNFEEQYGVIIAEIFNNRVAKEDVLGYSHKITALAKEVTDLADAKLREKID